MYRLPCGQILGYPKRDSVALIHWHLGRQIPAFPSHNHPDCLPGSAKLSPVWRKIGERHKSDKESPRCFMRPDFGKDVDKVAG